MTLAGSAVFVFHLGNLGEGSSSKKLPTSLNWVWGAQTFHFTISYMHTLRPLSPWGFPTIFTLDPWDSPVFSLFCEKPCLVCKGPYAKLWGNAISFQVCKPPIVQICNIYFIAHSHLSLLFVSQCYKNTNNNHHLRLQCGNHFFRTFRYINAFAPITTLMTFLFLFYKWRN